MLVMFGDNGVLLLAITDTDLQTITSGGRTLEYVDPPHAPQLVRDIYVFHGKDKDEVLKIMAEAGVEVTTAVEEMWRAGGRTDRPRGVN